MPNEHEHASPLEHHYPPTTAEWVTSPLMRETEVEANPLEPIARPPITEQDAYDDARDQKLVKFISDASE